jgi:DNA-binding SARP family transcriptional activator
MASCPARDDSSHPARWTVMVCLLGSFQVLKCGRVVPLRTGGKAELLLSALGLHDPAGVPRDTLLQALWPQSELALASQSLSSLVYSLNQLLGDALDDRAPVLLQDGTYRLNHEAGVGVDVACFEELARLGDRRARAGDVRAAIDGYGRAIALYRGDLSGGTDITAVVERERLRARYLSLLARLADDAFARGDGDLCLKYAHALLAKDPCREDAHRFIMRCHLRRGERSQALRQFRLCQSILLSEFDAPPEPATIDLYNQIRLAPEGVPTGALEWTAAE